MKSPGLPVCLLLAACQAAPAPAGAPSAQGPEPAERPAAAFRIPAAGAFSLPPDWTSCAADADCTIVALGCCDVTPVNRAHAAAALDALSASGRPHCLPKAACGPGPSGTWEGEPGVCVSGGCRLPEER